MGLLDALQNAGLPLQNTGVPSSVQQDEMPDTEAQGTSAELQPYSPPQKVTENPNNTSALISALAGLGLNILGANNGRGAAGTAALANADELISQGAHKNQAQFKAQQDAFAKEKMVDEAKALFPYLDQMSNPELQAAATAKLQYGDVQGAQQLMNQNRNDDKYDLSVDRYNTSLFNAQVGNERKAVGEMISSAKDAATATQKNLNPEVAKVLAVEDILSNSPKIPESAAALQLLVNSKKGDVKLSTAEAKTLFSQITKRADAENSKSNPISAFFGVNRDKVDPGDALDGFAASTVGQDAVDTFKQQKQSADEYLNHAQQLKIIEANLNNKNRPQALKLLKAMQDKAFQHVQEQQQASAAGAAPQAPAAPVAPAPGQGQRLYSPSTKSYWIKTPDGKTVPE